VVDHEAGLERAALETERRHTRQLREGVEQRGPREDPPSRTDELGGARSAGGARFAPDEYDMRLAEQAADT
jgi:hypothetical protein